MGHSGFKTGSNERAFTAQVFIQHYGAVQSHTAMARTPLGPQTSIATVLVKSSQHLTFKALIFDFILNLTSR